MGCIYTHSGEEAYTMPAMSPLSYAGVHSPLSDFLCCSAGSAHPTEEVSQEKTLRVGSERSNTQCLLLNTRIDPPPPGVGIPPITYHTNTLANTDVLFFRSFGCS